MMRKYPREKEEVIKGKVEEAFQYSPRRKQVRIYISPGTKEKCGFLKLGSKQEYELVILNTSQVNYKDVTQGCLFGGVKISYDTSSVLKYITIYPIPAKHDDLLTDTDCFGYVINFMPEKIIVWYTGDTGFSEEMGENFVAIRALLAPLLNISTVSLDNYKGMILLAHIGGFKPDEQYYYRTSVTKAFYKNHLGRLGICKMIECLKPSVCLISEFGEEFTNCRKALTDIFRAQYHPSPVILPADVNCTLRLTLDSNSLPHIEMEVAPNDFVPIQDIKYTEEQDNNSKEWEIKYRRDAG